MCQPGEVCQVSRSHSLYWCKSWSPPTEFTIGCSRFWRGVCSKKTARTPVSECFLDTLSAPGPLGCVDPRAGASVAVDPPESAERGSGHSPAGRRPPHPRQRPSPAAIPCTDGGDQLCSGGHFGFHRHDVEVHEVVESQVQHTVIWMGGGKETAFLS